MKDLKSIKEKFSNVLKENSAANTPVEELFHALAGRFLLMICIYEKINADYFKKSSFEELQKDNHDLNSDLLPENYETSFANPSYAVKKFGEKEGQLFSYFYSSSKIPIRFVFTSNGKFLLNYFEYFFDVYDLIKNKKYTFEELKKAITDYESRSNPEEHLAHLKITYETGEANVNKLFSKADLNDIRYLFMYGKYISDTEIKFAEYLNTYPSEKIKALARSTVKAFVKGFEATNKKLRDNSRVNLFYSIGTERIIKEIINELKAISLKPILSLVYFTPANKQFGFDHKFDIGLLIDEDFVKRKLESLESAYTQVKDDLAENSGILHFQMFGEKGYQPENKPENIKLTAEQSVLYRNYLTSYRQCSNKFIDRSATSFTAIQMPSPEIGENFEKIFEEMAEINMLDSDFYETIQKKIIDKLDTASFIHIKGKDKNETDFYVKLNKLADPDTETNFVNVGADLNIPVGEVFTTPVLTGTYGTLHFREVFLKGIKFIDLKFTFENGFIKDYTCANSENENDNKELVRENLLFPNSSLPLGEFAIGTNTLAYVFAKKFKIIDLLPILIIEKMGPHFAIGDTCFTMQEENKVYNPIDNKEVIARENELSALRKEDYSKAYTNVHIDMTLPYEEIEFISAVNYTGKKELIIKDGLFTVPGTEELNIPLLNENVLKTKSA